MRRGFTLIELLVVIAIIAILAAILFPVFARAKDAAKKTASLSNVKQIGTATMIYVGDYDDQMPQLYWYNPADTTFPTAQGFYYYPLLILPYAKNRQVFLCPNDRGDDPLLADPQGRGRFDQNSTFKDYYYGANPSYGYNYRYLNTVSVSSGPGGQPLSNFSGRSTTTFEAVGQTIVFAEATMKDKYVPGFGGAGSGIIRNDVGYSRIEPPFAVPTPPGLTPYNGWTGTYPNANSQGQLWGRFDRKRVLVTWLDGHASYPSIASLRAPGTTEDEVNRYWNGKGDQ
ncbi:MAG: prepilin-type N-terminal cleavage/methylation domain-containing protein [Fimbriimonadaceae bacterium]|nr:prepilin-type N-terminal cleavage/methylation domain-containing protein [Fimbriimonadaceae bacterium]